MRATTAARSLAAVAAMRSLARAAGRRPPVRSSSAVEAGISVVIPARDEARRIGPVLAAVVGAPGVAEVIVVDDESSDGTAARCQVFTVCPSLCLDPARAERDEQHHAERDAVDHERQEAAA